MIFEISKYIKLKTMFNKLQIFNFKIMKLKKMINFSMIVNYIYILITMIKLFTKNFI